MKVNLNQKGRLVLLALILAFLLPYSSFAKANPEDYKVDSLKVSDVPNDAGGGLVVSWTPLSKERRIIEYRVYRGTVADTLFYIGKIDVNLKTGIAGDSVFFYDSGWLGFVDLESPGKLKKEKGDHPGLTLYREFPRDINVNGPQLKDNYVVLGIAKEKEYLYDATKVEKKDVDGVPKVYSGLKLNQFEAMYKQLLPDSTYYYTVLAVDEARHYYPEVDPVEGIPRKNSPEKPDTLFSVFVEDANRLQFEWKLPVEPGPVAGYQVWMLPKEAKEDFEAYKKEQKLKEQNNLAHLADTSTVVMETSLTNPAFQIFGAIPSGYTDLVHGRVDIINGVISYEGEEYEINPDELENYYFIFAFRGIQFNSWSNYSEVSRIFSKELPIIQSIDDDVIFKVTDRIEDKGDYNTISWGKPIVNLTNTSYANENKSKLIINYEYVTNKDYKIKNIYFKISDKYGNLIADINEYYQDGMIKFKLPEGADPQQTLQVEITLKCNKDLGTYAIRQDLEYEDFTRSLAPSEELYLNEVDVSKYSYYIYKRNYYDKVFRLAKKFGPTQREYHDNIGLVNNFSVIVTDFDADKNLYLVNPSFSIYKKEGETDVERGSTISTNVWHSDLPADIEKYKVMADTTTSGNEQAILYYIKILEGQLETVKNDSILSHAAEITNDKERKNFLANQRKDANDSRRMHFLANQRKIAKRAYEYKLVLSDGKGHFTFSDIYVNPENPEPQEKYAFFGGVGLNHFFPYSNWFKWNMFPALLATLLFGALVYVMIKKARTSDLYIRPIAGIQEIDNAIGRATEMGRPILFVPGLSSIGDVATLAGLSILGRVAKKAAEYDTKILCPVRNYIVLPIAQEIIKEAHYEAGRPDSYDKNSAFFITTAQFAFVAGVNGIMLREKTATNFYMGMFWAEALIMTETGSGTGAIQIAGTDAVTQIPFFITTCDYTLIGEELYAASAYLAREPLMLGTLKGQDYLKLIITIFIVVGTLLSSLHLTFLINAFPEK